MKLFWLICFVALATFHGGGAHAATVTLEFQTAEEVVLPDLNLGRLRGTFTYDPDSLEVGGFTGPNQTTVTFTAPSNPSSTPTFSLTSELVPSLTFSASAYSSRVDQSRHTGPGSREVLGFRWHASANGDLDHDFFMSLTVMESATPTKPDPALIADISALPTPQNIDLTQASYATMLVAETGSSDWAEYFDIDASSLKLSGGAPEPEPDPAKVYVFLDFDDDVPAGFELREWWDLRPTTMEVVRDGTHPVADMSGYDLADLQARVQSIFDASQMEGIEVVSDVSKLPEGATIYTVNFGEAEVGFLEGVAYDTTTTGRGVDLFDRRKGGAVVVFPIYLSDATAEDQADLAETIAHEVGHGLGLKHTISPAEGVGVMTSPEDHDGPNAETFLGTPMRANFSLATQNAQFSVRHFALDEALGPLLDLYEIGSIEHALVSRTLEYQRILLRLDPDYEYFWASTEGASDGLFLSSLADDMGEDGILAIDAFDFDAFSIVGASTPGGTIDIAVGKVTEGGFVTDLLGSDFSSGEFSLFNFSSGLQQPLAVTVERRSYQPATVPLPASGILLGAALLVTRWRLGRPALSPSRVQPA